MLTQNQKDILTDLVIDNGLIYEEAKSVFFRTNLRAFERLQSVIHYCHTLFMECVYDEANDNTDYIEQRLVNLLSGIARYRSFYPKNTLNYQIFNSLFDKTSESFKDFQETL